MEEAGVYSTNRKLKTKGLLAKVNLSGVSDSLDLERSLVRYLQKGESKRKNITNFLFKNSFLYLQDKQVSERESGVALSLYFNRLM